MPDFPDHFSDRAAQYAAHRPGYPPALVDFLGDVAGRTGLAWDAGCGSGQLSRLLARRFDRVVASDASPRQLAQAARDPRVAYRCALSQASALPDAVVDLAVAAQAVHWFDLDAYYAEVRRVARAGAALALVTYGNPSVGESVDPVIHRFHYGVLDGYWPPERLHVEDGYRSLPFPFAELAAPALEIRRDWDLEALVGYVRTWSAVRALERDVGGAPVDAFRSELAGAWGAADTVRAVRWPLSLRVGRL